MAVNPKDVLKKRTGLPTKEEMLAGENTDNLMASIENPNTGKEAPASLTQGEYVFDIPSIIGLGQGDYNAGLKKLQQVHQMLQQRGKQFMAQQQQQTQQRGEQ